MPVNIRIQWNAGTACVSECVLKTIACRGLRVGPSKVSRMFEVFFLPREANQGCLDGRNRAIVIAESLARVIAAIRMASVCWRSHLPQNREISPYRPCVRCAAIRIVGLAFIRLTFVPRGTAEWLARVDRVR